MPILIRCASSLKSIVLATVIALLTPVAWAGECRTIYRFKGGADGSVPVGGVVFDSTGNLYGTTLRGGISYQEGTVFELSPNGSGGWTKTMIYLFGSRQRDAAGPTSLIFDAAGNLFGAAAEGGKYSGGAVFELTPNGATWSENLPHQFSAPNGQEPWGPVVVDAAGNIYGTTVQGGGSAHLGVVFELTHSAAGWTEMVLHDFDPDNKDGGYPFGLVSDAAGNLYGTTGEGGSHDAGAVFQLTPDGSGGWTEKILRSFDGQDGALPYSTPILDASGSLYGTTHLGGRHGQGVAYQLVPNGDGGWRENVLRSFGHSAKDGTEPFYGPLVFDSAGNLYGTTYSGGDFNYGTVFELEPTTSGGWNETILCSFKDAPGAYPYGGLTFDAKGNLFGTTSGEGNSSTTFGTVFEVSADSLGSNVPSP